MPLHLSRVRLAGASLILAAASVAMTALPVGAGTPQLSVDPTEVHAGDSIAVGSSCGYTFVAVGLFAGWVSPSATPETQPIVDEQFAITPGAWNHSITMPASSAAGSYTLQALCIEPERASYTYQNVKITVIADGGTTTTTEAPTTTIAATTTTLPADASPATAVRATPKYTG